MRLLGIVGCVVGLLLLGSLGVHGSTESQDAAAQDIGRLSWIAGSWTMEKGPIRVEELWTAPRAGTMMGVGRTMRGEKTVFYEFLRIEATPEGITYFGAPRGRNPATPFKMVEMTDDRVVFENPQHDYPTRITYWKEPDGGLGAKVEGKRNGHETSESWTFKRSDK